VWRTVNAHGHLRFKAGLAVFLEAGVFVSTVLVDVGDVTASYPLLTRPAKFSLFAWRPLIEQSKQAFVDSDKAQAVVREALA
jgi:hypothetical protein